MKTSGVDRQKKSFWEHYVTKNPMTVEINRFRKRYFTFSGPSNMNSVSLALVMTVYGIITLWVVNFRGDVSPFILLALFFALDMFVSPLMLHGAIAGEREKRTWDMLMVAPVTKGQIIAGKFLAASAAQGLALALFMIPTMIAAVTYKSMNWDRFALSIIYIISVMSFVNALTILLSSRVKRPLMALGATIGTLIAIYILVPSIIGIMSSGGPMTDLFLTWHPVYIIGQLSMDGATTGSGFDRGFEIVPVTLVTTAINSAFVFILLVWAEKTLIFADNEVKFINNKKKKVADA